jgi:lipopolysaccharide assembly protein A
VTGPTPPSIPSGSATPSKPRASRRLTPGQIVALIIVLLAVVFVIQNREPVSVQLLGARLSAPLWLLLTIMAGVGLLIGFLLARRRASRK